MRLLSTSTMAEEVIMHVSLVSIRTMQIRVLSTRTMAEDGDKHKNNANEVAKHKNDTK